MSRSPLVAVVVASTAAFAAACSHQPPPAADPATARVFALPSPRSPARIAAPPVPVALAAKDTAKTKEGDAIYFDFDSSLLREDARPVLQDVARTLRVSDRSVRIEGNCDELGTVEYNLALGEQRAKTAQEYLQRMGVPSERIATVSFGSQHPKYPGHDDVAHARNRRDDLVVR